MNIKLEENCSLDKPGVYQIKNLKNGISYIGSSSVKIFKRLQHHFLELKRNKHKNKHLQNVWNKYGEENFVFIALENVDKLECLKREQELIDEICLNRLYNINPLASGTPSLSKEVQIKKSKTMKNKWENGEIKNNFFKGHTPWNKGKKQGDIDYSYLKGIKKKNTEKRKESRIQIAENMRNRMSVYVYSLDLTFLGFWKNAYILEEESNNDDFKLIKHLVLKNKVGRNGYKFHTLKVFNVKKSINKGIPYKGLIFSDKPLHQEIGVEKLDKNGEGCDS